jgi:hypothetical protein
MNRNHRGAAAAIVVAVAVILLRLVHLDADTPPEVSSSVGPYVDEGYKTLSARNQVLFGTTHWNAEDRYEGWRDSSPLTHWPVYVAFRALGASSEAARWVPILYYAAFLGLFVWGMRGRYSSPLLAIGVFLLGVESTLFFFSRIAIFEIPIAAILYAMLFVLARWKPPRALAWFAWVCGMALLLTFGVKISSLFYVGPILVAAGLALLGDPVVRKRAGDWRLVLAVVVGGGLLAYATREFWWVVPRTIRNHFDFVPADYAWRLLDGPVIRGATAVVLAGSLCALHLLLSRRDLLARDSYRSSLVALVLIGLPLVAVFPYDPLRYYVPLLPAYLLIVFEWVHAGGWKLSPRPRLVAAVLCVIVLAPWWFRVINAFGPGEPGQWGVPIVALLLAVAVGLRPDLALHGRVVGVAVAILVPFFLFKSVSTVGPFLAAPEHRANAIRSDLERLLPADSSLAGVWAPFVALGTDFKALYVAPVSNRYERLPELAPDYVLHTVGNRSSDPLLRAIRNTLGVSLGDPVYRSSYNDDTIVLYPLVFNWRSHASLRRGPFAIGRDFARNGEAVQAEAWLRRAVEERAAEDPPDPLRITEARGELGVCLARLGRYDEAEPLLLEAHGAYAPGGGTPAGALARLASRRLGELYEAWGRPERAEPYRPSGAAEGRSGGGGASG